MSSGPALDNESAISEPRTPALAFMRDVSLIYKEHFWFFLRMIMPAVVLGYIAVYASDERARQILRHMLESGRLDRWETFAAIAVRIGGTAFSWVLYAFSFVAICSATRAIRTGETPGFDSAFRAARKQPLRVLQVALLLLVLLGLAFGFAMGVSTFLILVWRVAPQRATVVALGLIILFTLAISKLSLALPAVALDDKRFSDAFFHSDELTERKNTILFLLLLEGIGGSYLAIQTPYVVAELAWRFSPFNAPDWLGYVLIGLGMVGSALVQPSLFIGLAHLYETERTPRA